VVRHPAAQQKEKKMAGKEEVAGDSERGQKSKYLTQAEGGVLDTDEGYQPITDGSPEKGIFNIVGGYLDDDGVVHTEVQLRAMTGHEEDLLSNDAVPFFSRMTGVLSQCCERFGMFTEKPQIIKAIRGLPAGSRQHLLICLRRVSHWRTTKDIYDMKVECPKCGHDSDFKIDLSDLEPYEMEDPTVRTFDGKLPETGFDYSWRVTSFDQDQILSAVIQNDMAQHEMFTWSILIRLTMLNGMKVDVRPSEVIDPDKGKMLKNPARRVAEIRQTIKNLPVNDRQHLRDEFMKHEPGIETDIDFECPKCKKPFVGRLDLGQRSFFFPSAQRKHSNRRSFT
jgi:endogenous inhibitor of DNA gyrase (YacG/DUF329 family)